MEKQNSLELEKGLESGAFSPPYMFDMCGEYIMRKSNFDDIEAGVRMGGRRMSNLRYADDTTLLAESK